MSRKKKRVFSNASDSRCGFCGGFWLLLLFHCQGSHRSSYWLCAATPKHWLRLTILLDSTEPYSAVQLKLITNRIVAAVEGLKPLDRVRIYTVGNSTTQLLTPNFDFCKPDPDANESPIIARFNVAKFTFMLEES